MSEQSAGGIERLEAEYAPDCNDCGTPTRFRGVQGGDYSQIVQWICPECDPDRAQLTIGLPEEFEAVEAPGDDQLTLRQAVTDGGTSSCDTDRGMPDKKLMYESSPVDYKTDCSGRPIEVTLVECWGKSNRRARKRTLKPEDREYVSGGGYSYKNHGPVVHDGKVYEVKEISGERWWLAGTKRGDRSVDADTDREPVPDGGQESCINCGNVHAPDCPERNGGGSA